MKAEFYTLTYFIGNSVIFIGNNNYCSLFEHYVAIDINCICVISVCICLFVFWRGAALAYVNLHLLEEPIRHHLLKENVWGPKKRKANFFIFCQKKFPKKLRFRDFPVKIIFDAQDDENDVDVDSSGK